jgi:hypothetical protein
LLYHFADGSERAPQGYKHEMTLIIGFGNSQQFVMAGDRRFTNWDGSGFTDENVKVGSFTCLDARLAVAFAGLAKAPGFETATWILDTLLEVAKPDYRAENTLQRFCEKATRDFGGLPIARSNLRTAFLFGGFYGNNPPRPCFARISNYEYENGLTLAIAADNFSCFKLIRTKFSDSEPFVMATAGNPVGLNPVRIGELKTMLEERKPTNALVGKATAMIQEAADNLSSGGSVGKQISTAVIPSEPDKPVVSHYNTAVPTDKAFFVNGVIALPGQEIAFRDGEFKKESNGQSPSVPMLIPRNSPCPVCGSGKRYKRCCGAPPKKRRARGKPQS